VTRSSSKTKGELNGMAVTEEGSGLYVRRRRRYVEVSLDLVPRLNYIWRGPSSRAIYELARADVDRWAAAAAMVASHATVRARDAGRRGMLALSPSGSLWNIECLAEDDRQVAEALLGLEQDDYQPARQYLETTACSRRRCAVHDENDHGWGHREYLDALEKIHQVDRWPFRPPVLSGEGRVGALVWRPEDEAL
jgi:hypothetical protein